MLAMASLVDQSIASVAALLGDPTRVAIIGELMAGPELSSGSLAVRVGVGPSTTSAHLAKLIDGGLVDVRAEGRTRLYRIASPDVAAVFESLSLLSPPPIRLAPALRRARSCYDHIAGQLGVLIAEHLCAIGVVETSVDAWSIDLAKFDAFMTTAGLTYATQTTTRIRVRPCTDWTERTPHLAGWCGSTIHGAFLDHGWVTRASRGRTLSITQSGATAINRVFGSTS